MTDVLELPVHICMSANSAGEATQQDPAPPAIPISQHQLVTPLQPLEFERELADHPDKRSLNSCCKTSEKASTSATRELDTH